MTDGKLLKSSAIIAFAGRRIDAVDTNAMLHRLVIFKRPLEEEFSDRDELIKEIRKTVIHELAHHFGYTDRDLERWTTVY